ncbi:unnamed protein product [Sphenostylis stenocarpa]|uniref:Uncharacterized protein n=1 Tax=Sphenostylis stenocarpa TaxID=92480 RepID=A0AA86VBW8_9FABA|nr:unnamed protein product [Sphenostylis stenocarpa]
MKLRQDRWYFWDRKVHVEETQVLCVKVDYLQVEVTMQDCMKGKELLSFLRMFKYGVDENIEEGELRLETSNETLTLHVGKLAVVGQVKQSLILELILFYDMLQIASIN